ncbi:hypothetical protein PR048_018388 [Dryococelus australis]|uniref:DUF5641 domain-containing protein n=1 Tax=Dryococelus australis TaxID=614101 RepID=A0ABQ9HCB7_9NEOP|nr:hypothetical protein PR048_018388 [Dryococelus australis]
MSDISWYPLHHTRRKSKRHSLLWVPHGHGTPHFGGTWEAGAKSEKTHLAWVIGWTNPATPIKPNATVLLMDDRLSPLLWRIGHIMEVFPGKDGCVRVVAVHKPTCLLK